VFSPHKAIRLMLIVSILCLIALLLPTDFYLACSYQRPQAAHMRERAQRPRSTKRVFLSGRSLLSVEMGV